MNRIYTNQRASDVKVPGRTGNEITIPAGTSIRLESWFDRYVPFFLSISVADADQQKAVRPAICEVPRNNRPLVESPVVKTMLTETIPAPVETIEVEKKKKKSKKTSDE